MPTARVDAAAVVVAVAGIAMTPESTRRWIKRLRQERKPPWQTPPMSVQHRRKSPKAKIRQRLTAAEAEVVTACAATADPMATRQPPRHPKAPRAIPPHHHGKASKAMGPPIRRPTKPKATPPLRHGKAPRAMPLHRHGKAPRAIHPHRHCEAPKAIHRHRHCEAPKATWQSPHPRPSSPTCCPWNTSTASRRTAVCSGSILMLRRSQRLKRLSQRSPSPCMSPASQTARGD